MLWAQAHDAKLERGTIRPSVPDNVADFLSSGQKILHADHLVNKDNQAELIYLFQAILDDGKHLQILYLQGSKAHSNTAAITGNRCTPMSKRSACFRNAAKAPGRLGVGTKEAEAAAEAGVQVAQAHRAPGTAGIYSQILYLCL